MASLPEDDPADPDEPAGPGRPRTTPADRGGNGFYRVTVCPKGASCRRHVAGPGMGAPAAVRRRFYGSGVRRIAALPVVHP